MFIDELQHIDELQQIDELQHIDILQYIDILQHIDVLQHIDTLQDIDTLQQALEVFLCQCYSLQDAEEWKGFAFKIKTIHHTNGLVNFPIRSSV